MGNYGGNLQKIYDGVRKFAITPHIPGGFISADQLIKIAEVAKKYNGILKLTTGQRIMITNLDEVDLPGIWDELAMEPAVKSNYSVKTIEICPAGFCKRHKYNTMPLGNVLLKEYHGKDMPNRTKIGVAGCRNACGSVNVRDVGLIADVDGFTVVAGGSGGFNPRLADRIGEGLSPEAAMDLLRKTLEYYRKEGEFGEKMSDFIERIGLEVFKAGVLRFDLADSLPAKS